ncbi:hypothetical protein with DUF2431 [Prunus dulcis]|uniref:25S rRNA (uridine-N(3))-methyltransferase BMT5-like domain-containing protein n=1 Tax=Prunus dulcis TaxID=3755 RepID=A0A4Y1RBT7_PRUDU|nr:hypothetical protein with DUF2431 [Prunus dulcis]
MILSCSSYNPNIKEHDQDRDVEKIMVSLEEREKLKRNEKKKKKKGSETKRLQNMLVGERERIKSQMEAFSFERKIKHYSSCHRILLVGEGDFSFSVCLARAFGLAVNMVATSLDSRESLMLKYSKASSNVKELEARGCIVLHEVDVHSMSQHPFLIRLRFDRIIYNFPHAGYLLGPFSSERNRFHQDLIRGFLKNARELLTAIGEIHVTHKTTFPFSEWKIVELAHEVGLYLVDEEPFSLWDYPGYENKRGDGMCDQTFPVGMCSTFKFAKLFYHSSPSCFHLGITDSGPWSGYSGINGPHMERSKMGEKTIMHYSSSQKILLVGEGNFSFAACLAKEFGSAVKMVATSFDPKYSNVTSTLNELKGRGCTVLHEVDVHTMSQHPRLTNRRFDRIVFNFPHAGFISMEHNKIQIK